MVIWLMVGKGESTRGCRSLRSSPIGGLALAELRIDRWASACVSALPAPVELEALAMPANHGLGLHEDQSVVPVWPQTAERDPECAIRLRQLGTFALAVQNGQLSSQGEVLERERELRLQARPGGCEQDVQEVTHQGRRA